MVSELGRTGFALVLGFLWAASAGAEPLLVDNLNDSGEGSLRQAIIDANASPDQDTITFDSALNGTIELVTALPSVTRGLTIGTDSVQVITLQAPIGETLFDVQAGTTEVIDIDLAGGPIEIGAGNTFSFFQKRDAEFDESISEAGSLKKDGVATLTLLGTNSYTGGTEVAEGTLVGSTDSLPSAGIITNNAALVFDQATDGTHTGQIIGSGNVVKRGAGAVTFDAVNDYEGGTKVEEGTLVGNTDSIPGGVEVSDGATLELNQDPGSSKNISLTGTGNLIVNMEDASSGLTLTGDARGMAAEINQGRLGGNAATMPSTLTLDGGAVVEFKQDAAAGAGVYEGFITGAGSLEKLGAEPLTLRVKAGEEKNDYSGGTSVTQGGLIGDARSLQGEIEVRTDVDPEGWLEFAQESAGTFLGTISGGGSVKKSGAGTLEISTDQLYTGGTTITGGEIALLAELKREVVVEENGALSGTGTVMGDLDVSGRLAPGASVGTLKANSDVTFQPGSVYDVEVNKTDGADQLNAIGTVTINEGAKLQVTVGEASYDTTPTVYRIIDAGAAVEGGEFAPLVEPPFLDLLLEYSARAVDLSVARNEKTLVDFAQTSNELAVANGLETATGDPEFDADFAVVRGNWETIGTDAEVPVAINAMGGEQLAPFATQRLAIARRLYRAVDARMATLDWREWESFTGKQHFAGTGEAPPAARAVAASRALAVGAVASAQVGAPAFSFAPAPRESGLGGWIDAYGFLGSLDGNSNSSKVDYQIAGGNVAMDYRFLGQNLVGLAGGYARTRVDPKQRAGDADADTGQVGLYLGRVTPLYYVDVATRFAYSSIDTERKIDFSDLSRKATARFDAYSCGAHFAGGLNVVDFGGVVVQPTARFDYTHLYRESFTEKGADSLDLAVGTEKLDSIVAQLGARLFGQLEIGDGFWLMPELRARWMHEFGDTEREINAGLAGALTGGTWRVSSVSWPRDAAVLGVGWTITAPKYFQLYLDYDATLGSGVFENGMGLGLRFVW